MEALYRWTGFAVVWAALLALAVAAAWLGWRHRPRNAFTRWLADAWEWVAVRGFGKRYHLSREGAQLLFYIPKLREATAWRRNLVAFTILYSRRKGWKDPYA